jgi:dolichol-phosphate mannosyltransferase
MSSVASTGPLLKGLLSRGAGTSLHWFAGLPTSDPTNSFKAYRKDFLVRTPIESTAGFSLGLELTVKAHAAGDRVEEIPATWTDRVAGESRFKLMKWLPHYLRWYLWAVQKHWNR